MPPGSRRKTRPVWSSIRWKGTLYRMTLSPPELDLQKFLTQERHAIHLIGVAGSGMSGIAALAAIMRGERGVIIAGMHGKTTTTAMAAHVLRGGGLHPSHYVGAEITILGSNAHWDSLGEYFAAEGDESDGTLQLFHPEFSL